MATRLWSILVLALAVTFSPLASALAQPQGPASSDEPRCPCCDPEGCEPCAPSPACPPSRCPCLPEPARRTTPEAPATMTPRVAPIARRDLAPRPSRVLPARPANLALASTRDARARTIRPESSSRDIRLRTCVWLT